MNDVLTEVRFWAQIIGDAQCTVICPPDLESRIKGWVDARGLSGIITVDANRWCPENRIFVVDTPAIDAYLAEAMAKPIRMLP